MPRRRPLYHPAARTLEQLLGLRYRSLTGVERRANGDFALTFKTQKVGDAHLRVLRIPAKRVFGYQQRSPDARDRDIRARHQANARRFAVWLMWKLDVDAPIVDRALLHRDLSAVEELRAAVLELAGPDFVLFGWWRRTA